MAMAEHSMCHPGRPGPQGLGQVGSPGFDAFHSAKSSGSRLRSSTSTRAPAWSASRFLPDSLPYGGKRRTSKYTSPSTVYATPRATRRSIRATICGMWSVALGSTSPGEHPERGHVRPVLGDVALGHLGRRHALGLGAPDDPVVDVGEVLDEGDAQAAEGEKAADDVEDQRAARVADVAQVVGGDPADVHADLARHERGEVLLPAAERVEDLERHQRLLRGVRGRRRPRRPRPGRRCPPRGRGDPGARGSWP